MGREKAKIVSYAMLKDVDLIDLIVSSPEIAPQCFQVLVDRYSVLVRAVVSKFLKSDSMGIEDASQETFLKAFSKIRNLKNRARFKSWICTIARNQALDNARRRHLVLNFETLNDEGDEIRVEIADKRANPDRSHEMCEISEIMSDVLTAIPDLYREPIELRYTENLDYDEIASILGKPLGTVKSLIHRAKHLIRQELVERSWGEEGLHVLAS